MRSRLVLLVVAILLVAGFAALNWSEVMRPSTLLFGPVAADAPLGAILLALLALAVIAFVLSAGAIRTNALLESRHHYKELEAQRALADKAEASRFTELRSYLDENLRPLRDRDAMLVTELRGQTDATHRMLAARLNELEQRMDSRFERMGWGRGAATVPAMTASVPPVTRSEAAQAVREREHATAEEARQAQMREEERLRDERIRDERETRREERPNTEPTGWRRWF